MSDSTETTAPSDAPAPKKGIMGLLLPVGGAVAGIAIGAAVGLFVLGPRLAPASGAPAAAKTEAKAAEHGGEAHGGEEHGDGHKGGEPKPMYQIDNLVLNPAGSGGTRFLLVSVALEAKDEASLAQLKARDAELRDVILRMFGSKTVDQVSEASAREALRTELVALIQKTVPGGAVQKLYFPQFVIQ